MVNNSNSTTDFRSLPGKQQAVITNLGVLGKLRDCSSLDDIVTNSKGREMTLRTYLQNHCRRMMDIVDPKFNYHTKFNTLPDIYES